MGTGAGATIARPAEVRMAKLFFYYSAMNAGKTTTLLQSAYNYHERGMRTLILSPALDDRYGEGVVGSRIGLSAGAESRTQRRPVRGRRARRRGARTAAL